MANRTTFVTKEPVVLEGYQAIMKPSKYGFSLSAVIDSDLVDQLEVDRKENLQWAKDKLKNPKRSTLKPEPWEEVAANKYKIKFSWNEDNRPPVVDSEGTPITNTSLPIYSGSTVKIAFFQKPYILKDGVTYGTSLKLKAVQLISVNGSTDAPVSADDAAELFGTSEGFKAGDAVPSDEESEENKDMDEDQTEELPAEF